MSINGKQKGKRGELELAKVLRSFGFTEARRGVQYSGGGDSPDVVGLPGIHVECKRVEAGNLYNWLDQACHDAAPGRVPLVAHRRNDRPWVAILKLDDFLRLLLLADTPQGRSLKPLLEGTNAVTAEGY